MISQKYEGGLQPPPPKPGQMSEMDIFCIQDDLYCIQHNSCLMCNLHKLLVHPGLEHKIDVYCVLNAAVTFYRLRDTCILERQYCSILKG